MSATARNRPFIVYLQRSNARASGAQANAPTLSMNLITEIGFET